MDGEMSAATTWRNRITRHADVAPAELAAHPLNFRRHPRHQADALAATLDTVGYVQSVVVSERSGRILDGHLRVELAVARDEPTLPVAFVDVDDAEERLILATFDPLGAMAQNDADAVRDLLGSLSPSDDALAAVLDVVAARAGVLDPIDPNAEWQGMPTFEQEDKTAFHTLLVHFDSIQDVTAFGDLVQQAISDSTRFIWFPKKAKQHLDGIAFDES